MKKEQEKYLEFIKAPKVYSALKDKEDYLLGVSRGTWSQKRQH